jgi:hypothetical protein
MEIRPEGAELFRADGQTDMTKLIIAFRNFANASKNSSYLQFYVWHVAKRFAKKLEAQTNVCENLVKWKNFVNLSFWLSMTYGGQQTKLLKSSLLL